MGVKNFPLYKVTEHAKERILTRFNITKTEFDGWTSRLLSQGEFIQKQPNNREKYRLNDIVFIIDTHQRQLITVYSENEHDDNGFKVKFGSKDEGVMLGLVGLAYAIGFAIGAPLFGIIKGMASFTVAWYVMMACVVVGFILLIVSVVKIKGMQKALMNKQNN